MNNDQHVYKSYVLQILCALTHTCTPASKKIIYYLFLAALGLHCCAVGFLLLSRGYTLVAVHGFLIGWPLLWSLGWRAQGL